MSGVKLRIVKLYQKYPICCWCGSNESKTIDHVPSRAFFHGRNWPDGFEFPACESCNNETRHDELIFAALARVMPEEQAHKNIDEWAKLISGAANNCQEAFAELGIGRDGHARWITDNRTGLIKPYFEWNLGPRINGALHRYARRLVMAVHLHSAKRSAPRDSRIDLRIISNGDILEGRGIDILRMRLKHRGTARGQGKDLSSQFSWQYDFDLNRFVTIMKFGEAFLIAGTIDYTACSELRVA